MICTHRYPDGPCNTRQSAHVHEPLPCLNGFPERHHDFVPEPPHKHRYDRCECGARRKARAAA